MPPGNLVGSAAASLAAAGSTGLPVSMRLTFCCAGGCGA
jgi:hypothetical protein